MSRAYVGLGSNLGDREGNLRRAARALARLGEGLRLSGLYETQPVGLEDQPWFLNAVACLETELPPRQLLERLKGLERELGRRAGPRFGPRVVDLDLLLYGQEVIREQGLEIPHPRLHERRFVLAPLAELAPDLPHPVLGATVAELLERLGDTQEVRRL